MSDAPATPRLRPGVKFRFDQTRQAWVLLAPEKLFLPDDIAVEILKRVDGARTTDEIVADLARVYQAPAEVIGEDVKAMLEDLARKGALSL